MIFVGYVLPIEGLFSLRTGLISQWSCCK